MRLCETLVSSGEEQGTLWGREDMVVLPQAWISVVCLFLSSWSLPTGRGNELLVECNCVHAIPFVPTKNGHEGSRIHRFTALSAFSDPRTVSLPWWHASHPDDKASSKPSCFYSNRILPFCNSTFVPLRSTLVPPRTSWWPALQFPGSKSGSTQKRRRNRMDVHFLEVLGLKGLDFKKINK